ncbi:TIGR01459 family HAD-type hydrolase [Pseudogemmobacter faecipullorum]|uniref:TIGR01459 family HAD-type hydrolase n=1 Tax=Pseudogemmobacter faecipullorum TaxID=2755041 RepID=A0ABS8CHX8_9RHOB|nr:TIGR01459 family HAD-type hydrolase [Pseudogemmobacter faecipullorum]MCB5408970.1 TIGR01459 family HAD-type hydrolase [Pseudogemmobacter faecipullorum]
MTAIPNTRLISALDEIAGQYDAVFCDLWGCLHNGVFAFPAAVKALQSARRRGVTVVLLTNSPRPQASVIAQLDKLEVPRDAWDLVVTSGDAAQFGLLSGAVGRKVYHIGAEKDLAFFDTFADDLAALAASQPAISRVPLAEAEGIVCTGLRDDMSETPADYRAELLLGKTMGLKMLCANPDIMVDWGDKRIFCAGALAEAYEQDGAEALYFGKPHPPIYDLARRRLAAADGRENLSVLCIGDGINTDILGAAGEGLDALFITGGLHTEEFGTDPAQPEEARLQSWLGQMGRAPRWSIPFLA